jgi:PPP family 3-phenylpropionic acid transporter
VTDNITHVTRAASVTVDAAPGISLPQLKLLFALIGASDAALAAFMPLLLLSDGFRDSGIGIVLSLAALAAFLSGPAWGHAADRSLGAERTLRTALFGAAVTSVPLLMVHDRFAIAALVVAVWAMRAPIAATTDALALARLGDARRNGYAAIRLWASAGWAVAAVCWGAAYEVTGLRVSPLVYAVAIALVAIWTRRVLRVPLRATRPQWAPWRVPRLRAPPRGLTPFLVAVLLLMATSSASTTFIALRMKSLGGGYLLIGLAAGLQAAMEIPAMASIVRLTTWFTHRGLFVGGCTIFAATFVAWGYLSDPLALALLRLVMGVGFAFVYVGTVVIVDDLVSPRLRATGQGVARSVAFGLAPVLGTLGGGVVYAAFGARTMFFGCAAVAVAASLIVRAAVPEPDYGAAAIDPTA